MANLLTDLFKTPTLERRAEDYERVYDEFVERAGGGRVSDLFTVPPGRLNADYFFDLADCEVVLELKQTAIYRKDKTLDEYISGLLRANRVQSHRVLDGNRIQIDVDSLSQSEWNKFYRDFRPSVAESLNKAAGQLRSTDEFIPNGPKRRVFGVVVVNSGDYNLSVDLLHRLIEWQVRRKWKGGFYGKVDFVSCLAMDMVEDGRHPLHTRHIARTTSDPAIVTATRYLFEQWLHYGADAVGGRIEFDADAPVADNPINIDLRTRGKRQLVE